MRPAGCLLLALLAAGAGRAEERGTGPPGVGNFYDRSHVARGVLLIEPAIEAIVSEVGLRVVRASGPALDYEYTFRVLNDSAPNAWGGADGFVYVTTGLLAELESREELAAALAHEIAHDRLAHLRRFLATEATSDVLGAAAGITLALPLAAAVYAAGAWANSPYAEQAAFDVFRLGEEIGLGASTAYLRGYRAEDEHAADAAAVDYLVAARLNPCALVRVLAALSKVPRELGISEEDYPAHSIAAAPGLAPRIEAIRARIDRTREPRAPAAGAPPRACGEDRAHFRPRGGHPPEDPG